MRKLSALFLWLLAACSPRATPAEPPMSGVLAPVSRLGAGGALSLGAVGDGAVAVGTTRGVVVFDGPRQRWFTPSTAWVRSVSAGGGKVAFGAVDGSVGVLDGATGQVIRTLKVARSARVALSPDGARLALGMGSDGVRIVDVASGTTLHEVGGFTLEIAGLAWSPDGAALAAADIRGHVVVLRGEAELRLSGSTPPGYGMAWSPDSRLLAVAGRPLTVWDAATGDVVRQITAEVGRPDRLAFSPDGALLAGARDKGQVDLWSMADGALQRTLTSVSSETPELLWTEQGVLWMGNGAVNAVDPATGARGQVLPLLPVPTDVAAASGVLALGSADATVLWSLDSLAPLGALAAESGPLRTLAPAQGRLWLAEAHGLGAFDPSSGAFVRALPVRALGVAALRPSGGALAGATCGEDKSWSVVAWDLASGAERWREALGRAAPLGVAWSADGALIAVLTREEAIIFDASSGRARARRAGVMSNSSGMALSPAAPLVASVMLDRQVELWDPSTGKTTRRLGRVGGESGWKLTWSPDGEKLAVAAKNKEGDLVYVSDRAGGLGGVLAGTGPSAVVKDLAWSPDHAMLAAAVGDGPNQGQVVVWTSSGALLQSQAVSEGTPNAVAWSPDGARLFAAVGDGSVLVLARSP